jgi:hypothetical protein
LNPAPEGAPAGGISPAGIRFPKYKRLQPSLQAFFMYRNTFYVLDFFHFPELWC